MLKNRFFLATVFSLATLLSLPALAQIHQGMSFPLQTKSNTIISEPSWTNDYVVYRKSTQPNTNNDNELLLFDINQAKFYGGHISSSRIYVHNKLSGMPNMDGYKAVCQCIVNSPCRCK